MKAASDHLSVDMPSPAPAGDTGIFARRSDVLDRFVQLGLASGRVIRVTFPVAPDGEVLEEHPLLDRLFAYLDGEPDDLADVPIALTVPVDHRSVLEAVRTVPYGQVATVEEVARMVSGLGDDEDGRAVARAALEGNPVPLLVPDHRVVDGPSGAPASVVRRLRSIEESG